MEQNKLGQLIVLLRKENNLTQQQLANKLGVTYQAVSKWENGKSIPDILLLKKISEEYNISLKDLLDGKRSGSKHRFKIALASVLVTIMLIFALIIIIKPIDHYEFREIYTNNKEFALSGVVAYSKDKSSIYISNITYNEENNDEYTVLECKLYQQNGNIISEISQCGDLNDSSSDTKNLNELLEGITFKVDDYSKYCQVAVKENLFLEINAKSRESRIITYQIPLILDGCSN